jgi:hypothetical protein
VDEDFIVEHITLTTSCAPDHINCSDHVRRSNHATRPDHVGDSDHVKCSNHIDRSDHVTITGSRGARKHTSSTNGSEHILDHARHAAGGR